ncbi:hypothetical protein BN184_2490011 [Clostridioides difficile T3]|nr:hypothetical protein BN184_2490011 [Clostridioides difficile T3]
MIVPENALKSTIFTYMAYCLSGVCAVAAIFNPVTIPLEIEPTDNIPVSGGASVTVAPGTAVNELFGAVDW